MKLIKEKLKNLLIKAGIVKDLFLFSLDTY